MSEQHHEFSTRSGIGTVRVAKQRMDWTAPGVLDDLVALRAENRSNKECAEIFDVSAKTIEMIVGRYNLPRKMIGTGSRQEIAKPKKAVEVRPPRPIVERVTKRRDADRSAVSIGKRIICNAPDGGFPVRQCVSKVSGVCEGKFSPQWKQNRICQACTDLIGRR